MLQLQPHRAGTTRGMQCVCSHSPVLTPVFRLQAAIGFLCMQPQADGHNCVSRVERRVSSPVHAVVAACAGRASTCASQPLTAASAPGVACVRAERLLFVTRTVLQLQNTYKGTGEEELQATMNRHFGYAHAGGMQDTVRS